MNDISIITSQGIDIDNTIDYLSGVIKKREMKKTMSIAAQAAKAIRKELKEAFPGIKFKVKSDNFSMGNSVDINWVDGPMEKEVAKITAKYQYGHFNGMEDIYEYSNKNTDIPQVKFVSNNRELSFDYKKTCADMLNEMFGTSIEIIPDGEVWGFKGIEGGAVKNDSDREFHDSWGCWPSTMIFRASTNSLI